MPESINNKAVIDFLANRGYTPAEIEKIVAKMASYDEQTVNNAIFDSIGRGTFSLDDIIREALAE